MNLESVVFSIWGISVTVASMRYFETTDQVEIVVEPFMVREKSRPALGYFFYAYHVIIKNARSAPVQLLSREWVILDGQGHQEIVKGEGVVGLQPVLNPGDDFEYTSFCPLRTPTGNMRGYYFFKELTSRRRFRVRVPLFFFRPDQGVFEEHSTQSLEPSPGA